MRSDRRTVLATLLLALAAGCAAPPTAIQQRRQIVDYYSRGSYGRCVRESDQWLLRHEVAYPKLAPGIRFFKALAYRDQGETEKARMLFRDIVQRYADVPEGHPAVKWRRWAEQELSLLAP